MKYYITLFLLLALLATSCKKEAKVEVQNTNIPVDILPYSQMNSQIQPIIPVAPQQQTAISNPTISNAVAKGANPAHGQPGHRCDIPVGAPLNSPPSAKPQAPAQPAAQAQAPVMQAPITQNIVVPPPTSTTPATVTGPTAPGMNPPHGQPNHKCEIPVGSPLPKE